MAGRYKADRNADGTWNVRGVPVFASNRLRKVEVTKEWQERAVATASARFALNGYIPPLHENHHGDLAPVKRLGGWMPKRVVKIKAVEQDETGAPVVRDSWATEADLVNIPEAEYQRIKRGDLPYVSVEARMAEADFASLAMLPTQAPAIPLPPLTIGAEEYATNVVTYAATVEAARTTMRFSASMDESKKPDEVEDAKAAAATPASTNASVVDPKATDAAKMDEQKPEGEKPATPGVPEKPVPAVVEPVEAEKVPSWAASLMGTINALADLVAKIGQPKSEQPVAVNGAYSVSTGSVGINPHQTTTGATMTSGTIAFAAPEVVVATPAPSVDTFAAINGKIAALEGWKAAREAEDALRTKVKPFVARCLARVPSIDADELFAAVKEHGIPYAEAYTKAVEQFGVAAPPGSFGAATATTDAMVPELVAYQSAPPETFAAAKQASELYDAAPHLRGPQTRARWIENHLTAHKIATK